MARIGSFTPDEITPYGMDVNTKTAGSLSLVSDGRAIQYGFSRSEASVVYLFLAASV